MFKKPIKLGGQNQLSGKDKKTIKNKLVAQFDPETVEKLFANNDKIICNKISGSKMLIYVSDDYPLFVDGTGKEEYFPSVYTGAAYEPLAKRLYINEGVEGFIFNGANLMWPGVKDLSRLGNFKKDEIVSIVNSANEVIAIGAMGCSLDELKNNPDGSGIAVYILHFRGDKLWDLGTKVYPEVVVKAKEPKIEAKVQQPPVVAQPKVEEQSKPEKGKGKKEVKQVKEDSESQPEEPVKEKPKDKNKRVSFNQEVQVSQPKGKGKGKKQKKVQSEQQQPQEPVKGKGKGKKEKKVESDQEPEEPVKTKGKGKKDKKADSDEEKPEQPVKGKGKGKKEKKQQSDQEKVEEVPKGKGKGKTQTKQQKAAPKKKEESQESDDEIDFGNLVHDKKPARVQPPKAQKKVIQFSDEEDDKKGKKKGGKKGGNKKKQSDDEEVQAPKPKHEQKGKKKVEDSDEEVHVQKKGKNKKQQSDQSEPQVQKVEKKKGKNAKKKKEDSDDQNEEETKQEKPAKVEQGEQENEEGAKSAINGQLMDEYFKEAFLNVLKLSKVEGQLPIDSGRFFSDYMILARPEGVKLQIKDTTYKKLGKFYEEMAKKKFIEFKPAKEKKGQQGSTITKIFWQNEELKNYFPTIKKMGDKDVEEKVEQYSKQKLKLTKTLEIEYVYKLNEELKKILLKKVINYMPDKSDDEEGKQEKKELFFTEKQLKEKIEKYINEIALKDSKQPKEGKEGKQGKEGKDKEKKTDKIITLNYKENEFIYGLLKKQIEEYEQNLEKEEMMAQHDSDEQEKKKGKKDKTKKSLFRIERGYLVNKIMKLASPYYNMSDKSTGLNKFKQGTFKGIQLIADKVINKNVTKIIGLESFAPSNVEADELVKQIHGFAHQLQVKFASSANVQNLPGKNAGKEIVIQGNFVDELETILTTEFGIKKDYITIQNKLGKKKKN